MFFIMLYDFISLCSAAETTELHLEKWRCYIVGNYPNMYQHDSDLRKGGESSWSGPWHLRCTLEVFHVHSYQDQFIQPGWAECVFCVSIFSLGLCFAFVLFDLFVSPFFCVSLGSWVISLTVFGTSITNLNESPRALATCTIMWVMS